MDDDVMMPQEVKQISPWAVSALLLLGVVIALFVFYLLMLPAGIRRANSKKQSGNDILYGKAGCCESEDG